MSAENPALDEIAAIVRNARKVANFTQAELAVYAGCSLITVQNIERGIGNPTITVLGQILVALKCPQVWIAGQSVTFPTVIRERGRKATVTGRSKPPVFISEIAAPANDDSAPLQTTRGIGDLITEL